MRHHLLNVARATIAIGLALGITVSSVSAQEFIQRHWISGVDAKVVPAPVWVTNSNLGQVNEGAAVSFQLQATDADTYAASGLPAGLALDAAGQLSGVAPMVEASVDQTFTVTATNAGGGAARSFTLRVIDTSVPPPEWTTAAGSLGEFTEQTEVSIQLQASNGAGLSILSGALPDGLSLSSSGLLSGTAPSVEANTDYAFTVRAENDGGHADRAFTLRLIDIPSGKQIFSSVGPTSYTVPQGVTKIRVKAWGGSGAGGGKDTNAMSGGRGGNGAFVNAVVDVTPGETLTVVVAGGGFNSPSPSVYAAGGGGGGASAVHNSSKSVLVAAAGGGGGGASIASNRTGGAGGNAGGAGSSSDSAAGGGGAGTVNGGGAGGFSSTAGMGGGAGGGSGGNGGNTQAVTAGGSSSFSRGGSGGRDSGGGGGGAFAGGGGGYGTSAGGGGGGGASKIVGGTGSIGSGGDADYAGAPGGGGASGTGKKNGANGTQGQIVLIYGPDVQ